MFFYILFWNRSWSQCSYQNAPQVVPMSSHTPQYKNCRQQPTNVRTTTIVVSSNVGRGARLGGFRLFSYYYKKLCAYSQWVLHTLSLSSTMLQCYSSYVYISLILSRENSLFFIIFYKSQRYKVVDFFIDLHFLYVLF